MIFTNETFASVLPLIVVGILSLVVGFLLGGLFSTSGRKGKQDASSSLFRELFTVLQHRKSGAWIVEIGGRKFRASQDLNEEQKHKLLQILTNLVQVLGGTPLSAKGTSSFEPASPLSNLKSQKSHEVPELDVVDVLSQAMIMEVEDDKAEEEQFSIVRQIDEILQKKLRASALENKAVRLIELPNKGMVVMVGTQQYDSVEAVPHEEIRSLIRESVREWESHVDRGLIS